MICVRATDMNPNVIHIIDSSGKMIDTGVVGWFPIVNSVTREIVHLVPGGGLWSGLIGDTAISDHHEIDVHFEIADSPICWCSENIFIIRKEYESSSFHLVRSSDGSIVNTIDLPYGLDPIAFPSLIGGHSILCWDRANHEIVWVDDDCRELMRRYPQKSHRCSMDVASGLITMFDDHMLYRMNAIGGVIGERVRVDLEGELDWWNPICSNSRFSSVGIGLDTFLIDWETMRSSILGGVIHLSFAEWVNGDASISYLTSRKSVSMINSSFEKRNIRIIGHPGIGDMMINSAIAASLREEGHEVSIESHRRGNPSGYLVTEPDSADLPFSPLIGKMRVDSEKIKTYELPEFDWIPGRENIVIRCLHGIGSRWGTTPLTGCLIEDPSDGDISFGLTGSNRYILIAPDANDHYDLKHLSEEQVVTISRVIIEMGFDPVMVGKRRGDFVAPIGVIDLRERTTLDELAALVSSSEAVVCAESGVGHVAAAYWIPALWICPIYTLPHSVSTDYKPTIWLSAEEASLVSVDLIEGNLRRLISSLREEWCIVAIRDGLTKPCGVASSARRIAQAAGVEFRTAADGIPNMSAVIDWHGAEKEQWGDFIQGLKHPSVLSIHQGEMMPDERMNGFTRGKYWWNRLNAGERKFGYVPLPTFGENDKPIKMGLIATHGRPEGYHGYDVLKKAVEIVKETFPFVELRIVASKDGSAIPETEMMEALSEAHIFVYPYIVDGDQSACVPDVMSFGRPIIISGSTALDDYRGWAISSEIDPESIAREMIRLIDDRDLYEEWGERARLGACYRSPEIVAKQYRAAIIQEMLDVKFEMDDIRERRSSESIMDIVSGHTLLTDDRLMVIYDACVSSRGMDGCVVELGCFTGGVSKMMSLVSGKTLHIFDTFSGIPTSQADDDSPHSGGDFSVSESMVREYLSDIDDIEIHSGIFPDTAVDVGPIVVAHCDCDTETGTYEFLKWVWPALCEGGFVIMDDYENPATPGVTRAIETFSRENNVNINTRMNVKSQCLFRKGREDA